MNDIKYIVLGLESCNHKCRKCNWHNKFSGECMLMDKAAKYIRRLKADNAKKMVYCKDCIFCEYKPRPYMYHGEDKYICKNREGLSDIYGLQPMDHCSRGKAKPEV